MKKEPLKSAISSSFSLLHGNPEHRHCTAMSYEMFLGVHDPVCNCYSIKSTCVSADSDQIRWPEISLKQGAIQTKLMDQTLDSLPVESLIY